MLRSLDPSKDDYYQRLPKVELHRHLEGSLRVDTMQDIAREYDIPLPKNTDFRGLVQVMDDDPPTFQNFLSKFDTLRKFYISREVIQRIAYEAVEDAAADNVRYMEMIFTPVALARINGSPLGDVMDWVIESVRKANADFNIQTRLIASANRHESTDLAAEVIQLAVERKSHGIIGMNLVGNEAEFPAKPFLKIFQEAHRNGLSIALHAGEWAGAENVREAIEDFRAQRIGHGVRVLENNAVVELAQKSGVVFEVCPTSNYQSGVVRTWKDHPIKKMLEAGLNITVNTDDPGVSTISLSDEYRLVCEELDISRTTLKGCILSAAQAVFLPQPEKDALIDQLKNELFTIN
ncbi:MAG: adenosine deaminase [Anaerolineaceae bacterium]|nr:adenosine deaminase [Anaerolineaceae bacterium]